MDDEAVIKVIVAGVGIFLALAIFSAMQGYYATAKYEAKNLAYDPDPDGRYDKAMESTFDKEELYGYEIKSLINYYFNAVFVRVDVHNASYLNAEQSVLFRAFINANDSDAGEWNTDYEEAVNLIFPFQKFKLTKFETDDYTTYILNGKYDKSKEDTFNIANVDAGQIKAIMQYYYENTYVIVDVANVQEIRTRDVEEEYEIPPVYPATEPTIGTRIVQEDYVFIQNFYNANNSSATSNPGTYDNALVNVKPSQSYTLEKVVTDRYIRYTITGVDIGLE